jgi:hypothetical protein
VAGEPALQPFVCEAIASCRLTELVAEQAVGREGQGVMFLPLCLVPGASVENPNAKGSIFPSISQRAAPFFTPANSFSAIGITRL